MLARQSPDIREAATATESGVAAMDAGALSPEVNERAAEALREIEQELAVLDAENRRAAFVSARDLMEAPRPVWIIEGIAVAGGVQVLVGEPGAGKTFLLLGLATSVAEGRDWCGRRVEAGSVAFVSFEADALGLRLSALAEAGHELSHVYLFCANDPLSPVLDRYRGEERPSSGELAITEALGDLTARLEANGRPPLALLIIDTVSASLSGSEDSAEHVAAYLRAVRRLLAPFPGAAALLCHHAGWQEGRRRERERGSSAFRGNVEGTLYLAAKAGADRLTLRTLKLRNGERPPDLHLVRRVVELTEPDDRGRAVTSCLIELDSRSAEELQAEREEAERAGQRRVDLAVLRVIRDQPRVTSRRAIRRYARLRSKAVSESIERILSAGWVKHSGQRQPYLVTSEGLQALKEATE